MRPWKNDITHSQRVFLSLNMANVEPGNVSTYTATPSVLTYILARLTWTRTRRLHRTPQTHVHSLGA